MKYADVVLVIVEVTRLCDTLVQALESALALAAASKSPVHTRQKKPWQSYACSQRQPGLALQASVASSRS
jgi:hypothetical protein